MQQQSMEDVWYSLPVEGPMSGTRPINIPPIGLTGHLSEGKDSVAAIFIHRCGLRRNALADVLKRQVYGALCGGAPDVFASRWRDVDDFLTFGEQAKRDPNQQWVRKLYQFWGTEIMRAAVGPDYWIQQARIMGGDVVPDIRFPNECAAIKEMGGLVFRVQRDGYGGDDHDSERFVNDLPVDGVIDNNGTLAELEEVVTALIDRYNFLRIA